MSNANCLVRIRLQTRPVEMVTRHVNEDLHCRKTPSCAANKRSIIRVHLILGARMNVLNLFGTHFYHAASKISLVIPLLFFCCCIGCTNAQEPTATKQQTDPTHQHQDSEKQKHTNALAKESSPYLLMHLSLIHI